jgi:anthranilate phosphoribosyltransferase
MKEYLASLKNGSHLSFEEMQSALHIILSPDTSQACIGAFLMGLAQRGEISTEIAAAADFLRKHATPIHAPENAVDCCGTGGDLRGTYNISTAAALVIAACGIPMSKHGNKSASSKSGAADVLEALGVPLQIPSEILESTLQNLNFCFLMAPYHHQVLKPLSPIRKALGIPTIFNLLGPLANPAGTKTQLIGVYDKKWLKPMAEALKTLGTKRAWVVHGKDGLDEITLTDDTLVTQLHEDGSITNLVLSPSDFGLPACTHEELKGGDATYNAAALTDVLNGTQNAYRNIVIANAAAVILLSQKARDLKEAANIAAHAIDSGKAKQVLEDYIKFTKGNIST